MSADEEERRREDACDRERRLGSAAESRASQPPRLDHALQKLLRPRLAR